MLRTFINSLRTQAAAEDGTTVPEYMLVLGFISLVVVIGFDAAGVTTAITTMAGNLAAMINP